MSFVIGRVVRLVGGGIGLGREAYLHNKEKKARAVQSSSAAAPSVSLTGPAEDEDVYVQLTSADANELIARGEAVDVTDEKRSSSKLYDFGDDESDYSDSSEYSDIHEEDEQDWALDEAAAPPSYEQSEAEKSRSASLGTLIHEVVPDYHSTIPNSAVTARLPYPVIIPQRRPGTKTRGFVHAYAPDLAPCGIDQDTFIRFIQNFHKASQASPIFNILVVSANIAGLVPSVIAMAVSISVQVAARTGQEMQGRYRTNTYLDDINKELFMPHGLYAMVIKYKPDTTDSGQAQIGEETIDMITTKAIAKYAPGHEPAQRNLKAKLKNIRLASGESQGESAMPTTCCPLTFPALDATLSPPPNSPASAPLSPQPSTSSAPSIGLKTKASRATNFIADYHDRRARATYKSKNPTSTLASTAATPYFRSRFSDPNHAANSGHIVNLVTGGKFQHPAGVRRTKEEKRADKGARRQMKREYKDARRISRGREPRGPRNKGKGKGPVGMLLGGVKRVLREDVVYLIIVNLPSEAELREGRRVFEEGSA
ncbi:hypothetical protein BDV97DRAFT_361378 [Delphinella strobiligena]|nr:hypothetical protein BDV97DRAFT_361378 [Delphinella strobiligena]